MTINSPYSFSRSPGVYNVMLTVTDKDGGVSTAHIVNNDLTAPAYVVIYDPSAGFVTGGGWVVVSRRSVGRVPDRRWKGVVRLRLQVSERGRLPLSSSPARRSSSSTPVRPQLPQHRVRVAGRRGRPGPSSRATGTINGSGDYGFMLTAIDGAVAGGGGTRTRFRIKIWDKSH